MQLSHKIKFLVAHTGPSDKHDYTNGTINVLLIQLKPEMHAPVTLLCSDSVVFLSDTPINCVSMTNLSDVIAQTFIKSSLLKHRVDGPLGSCCLAVSLMLSKKILYKNFKNRSRRGRK